MKRILVLVFIFFSSSSCWSYENLEAELKSGTTMSLTQFQGEGKKLLLWLPSERGFGQGYISVALNLSLLEYNVWAVHLHESYIIPTGRNSLNGVEINDLLELIDQAQQQGFEDVYLVSSSRGVLLSLKTAYQYQKLNQKSELLKGLLIFSPYLLTGNIEMGQDAVYDEIASFSNLPVYMLQPQYGTKFARSREIAGQLQQGGSPVFMQVLRGAQAGFYMRPDEDLTEQDLKMREQLPRILDNAINLLKQSRPSKFIDLYQPVKAVGEEKRSFIKEPALHPFKGNKSAPSLLLKNLKNNTLDIKELKDSVVLVNFWATWCGPCVEEIPSLSRLVDHMQGKPFKVVAVNIGESPEKIQKFVKSIPVNFEILLDTDGNAVRDWKVYAYPSNYLLDKNGQIQFAYRGALQWDAENIINTIDSLLE